MDLDVGVWVFWVYIPVNRNSFSPIAMGICPVILFHLCTSAMQEHDESVSQPEMQRTVSFNGTWTPLMWWGSYVANPKEYFKAMQEENRRRDKTGWRRIAHLNHSLKTNSEIEQCEGASTYIRKQQRVKKKGRPVVGTVEARSRTAAACEANRRRHETNRRIKERKVTQEPT